MFQFISKLLHQTKRHAIPFFAITCVACKYAVIDGVRDVTVDTFQLHGVAIRLTIYIFPEKHRAAAIEGTFALLRYHHFFDPIRGYVDGLSCARSAPLALHIFARSLCEKRVL